MPFCRRWGHSVSRSVSAIAPPPPGWSSCSFLGRCCLFGQARAFSTARLFRVPGRIPLGGTLAAFGEEAPLFRLFVEVIRREAVQPAAAAVGLWCGHAGCSSLLPC